MKPRLRFTRGAWQRLPLSPDQARDNLRANGITVTEWSRKHGFDRYTVTDLLRGKRKGLWGEAHRAAVALGLKATS